MEIQNHHLQTSRARGQHPTAAIAPPNAWTGSGGLENGGVGMVEDVGGW